VRRLLLGVLAVVVAGCGGGPILANPPVVRPSPPAPASPAPRPADPLPILFPADDAPHDRLTEWWYYTGHLTDAQDRRFGFEYVIFRAERGAFPVSWASHLALTDEAGGTFLYAQRSEVGPGVDRSASEAGLSLSVTGDPLATAAAGAPWTMAREGEVDRLVAEAREGEVHVGGQPRAAGTPPGTPFRLDLRLTTDKPPALHDRDGWIDFGPAGSSYYYSRTRMAAEGSLGLGAETFAVDGTAWFDHQWGDFISVGGGGWDWYAINLDDGTDLTLSVVRDQNGRYPLVYGTLVAPDGTATHLDADDFSVESTATWTSPATGATYPAAWLVSVAAANLEVELQPTVAAQELDTRETTGVVYWEGSQKVNATVAGRRMGGQAYVELTGYASAASR